MPSFEQYLIPPPTDSAEFENIVLDYFRLFYADKVQPYGRRGQCQEGIDLYIDNGDGTITGIQCKDYIKHQITRQNVAEIVSLAETFPILLSQLIIVVANCTDAKIQKYVLDVDQNRRQNEKFGVRIIFWESIISKIKENHSIFLKYYPFIACQNNASSNSEAIEAEREMLKNFFDIVNRNEVLEYLSSDIFIRLLYRNIELMDQYDGQIRSLLMRFQHIYNSVTYQKILLFYRCLDSYQNEASALCHPNWNYEVFQAVGDRNIMNEMNQRRFELLRIYNNICTFR